MRISDWSSDVCSSDLFRNEAGTDDRAATERNQLGDLVTRFLGGRVRALLDLQAELLLEFGERGQSAAVTDDADALGMTTRARQCLHHVEPVRTPQYHRFVDRKSTRLNSSH